MAKRKKKRRYGVMIVGKLTIRLECSCGKITVADRVPDVDTTDTLDEHAAGWYTNCIGVAMCPKCTIEKGMFRGMKLHMTESIHGKTT